MARPTRVRGATLGAPPSRRRLRDLPGVCFAWIFFRADSFAGAWDLIGACSPPGVSRRRSSPGAWSPRSWPESARSTCLAASRFGSWPGSRACRSRAGDGPRGSPSSSSTRWARRAWHRSSTSGSDGDERDTETPPPPRRRTAEGGRRLHSAGSAIVVSLMGLGVERPPQRAACTSRRPSSRRWKRDVALGVTGPLESVC